MQSMKKNGGEGGGVILSVEETFNREDQRDNKAPRRGWKVDTHESTKYIYLYIWLALY